jgi:hypothetical protein
MPLGMPPPWAKCSNGIPPNIVSVNYKGIEDVIDTRGFQLFGAVASKIMAQMAVQERQFSKQAANHCCCESYGHLVCGAVVVAGQHEVSRPFFEPDRNRWRPHDPKKKQKEIPNK